MTTERNMTPPDISMLAGKDVVVRTSGTLKLVGGKLYVTPDGLYLKSTRPAGADMMFAPASVTGVEHKKHLLVVRMVDGAVYEVSFSGSLRPGPLKAAFAAAVGQPLPEQSGADKAAMWIPAIGVGVVGLIGIAAIIATAPGPGGGNASEAASRPVVTETSAPIRVTARAEVHEVDITYAVGKVRELDGHAGPQVAEDIEYLLRRYPDARVVEVMVVAEHVQDQIRDLCGGRTSSVAEILRQVVRISRAGSPNDPSPWTSTFDLLVNGVRVSGCD